ncbi:unknown [Clostridium sp. CAG:306]|nr:unknown [Clostridium sp. CAG:306]DAB20952.1 MAG TPA: hypothetical protein CPT85_08685 [Candidatus Gastranaerophilales bacterium HUM_21]
MQNYQVGYQPNIQTKTQTQAVPAAQNNTATGATFNIGTGTPGSIPANGANGVVINIMGASVNPNGANINNTYNTTQTGQAPAPTQAYDKSYYTMPAMQTTPTVPVAASSLNDKKTEDKPKKDIVLLTDDYIKTLENYLRNDNPDIKLMGAKEVMKRFREDESRKGDPALTALLNLMLQSKYSSVKMIGMGILENGWAQGDSLTQQLLGQIQHSKSGYGLDALDAAQAALKTAGQTIKVVDNNPPKPKETKTDKKDK